MTIWVKPPPFVDEFVTIDSMSATVRLAGAYDFVANQSVGGKVSALGAPGVGPRPSPVRALP